MNRNARRQFSNDGSAADGGGTKPIDPRPAGSERDAVSSSRNATLDALVALAADALGAPMAFASVRVLGRHFIRAQHGIAGPLRPADNWLSPEMLAIDRPMVLACGGEDGSRFPAADLLGARFAAVFPVRGEGEAVIGLLCVLDDRPRPASLSDRDVRMLERLAALAQSAGAAEVSGYRQSLVADTTEPAEVLSDALRNIVARRTAESALRESEEHHRYAVELSPQIPWTADPDGAVDEVGPLWPQVTGRSREEARGYGWLSALHPDDVGPTLRSWREALQRGEPVDVQYRVKTTLGDYRWMRARAAPRYGKQGRIIRWYGTLEDIHDHKLAQQALGESEERFRLAVQSARLGIWDYDAVTGRRQWSAELRDMLGLGPDAEPTIETALRITHPDDRRQLKAIFDAAALRKVMQHFETVLRIHRADTGEERWLKSMGWKTLSGTGQLTRLIVTFQDVTDERNAEQRVRWAATHDPLTGLPNRTALQETLERTAAECRAANSGFGLLLLDVDDLKRTNDTLGHDAGDALLRTFAERLSTIAPRASTVGRLGGDEFAIIVPRVESRARIEEIASALLSGLREPFLHDGRTMDCAASIGASLYPHHGDVAAELLKSADLALYAAKAAGRGRMMLFAPDMRADMQRRSSMMSMAGEAIRNDWVLPFYQPKIDLRSKRIVGFEALLRWRHPDKGIQLPETISAAFEDTDLAIAITRRMLDRVTSDLRRWLDAGLKPGSIALNVSAADFKYDDFAERVLDRLATCGLPSSCLEIEVTETVFLGRGAQYAERALKRLSKEGLRIALDDFGTGYASLSHLKQYPVDIIKIDRSFVSNVEASSGDAAIVDAVVKLGRSLGIETVAEGVETEAQAEYLRMQGCRIAQGFLFGRPASADDTQRLMQRAG